MAQFLAKRMLFLVPVAIAVTLITFVVTRVIPANPAQLAAGLRAGPEQVEQLRRNMGLDKPLYVQYVNYLKGLVRGDFGSSMRTRQPVIRDILRYFPATAELALVTMLILVMVGIPFGILTATTRRSVDVAVRSLSIGITALPTFWLALVLQFFFFFKLRWLPALGQISSEGLLPAHPTHFYILDSVITGRLGALPDVLLHMVMPVSALVAGRLAIVVRMTRAALLEELRQEYVRTARAKGLGESGVLLRHALRNSLIPIVTELGLHMGWLLGGAVFVVELIFSWPGIGLYAIKSIMALDYMPIMGTTLIMTLIFVIINLLVDVSYTFLNPRIRY